MALLPKVQTADRNTNQLQDNIAQMLRPFITNPVCQGNIVSGVNLVIGSNTINHGLDRTLQGWIITGVNGIANIYDKQASNSQPTKTLILVSDAAVKINLYCF